MSSLKEMLGGGGLIEKLWYWESHFWKKKPVNKNMLIKHKTFIFISGFQIHFTGK